MQYHVFQNGIKIPMVGLGTFPLKGETLSSTIKDAIGKNSWYWSKKLLYKIGYFSFKFC